MNIVHLALTPLAGAPIRIVQALNRHTSIRARLINFNPAAYGSRVFDEDIDFRTQADLALELIDSADLIHLHHWMDLENNPFGIDLRGRKLLRHFHSEPAFIQRHTGVDPSVLIGDEHPQIVVAQFHERLYPRARPVPNLINFDAIDGVIASRVNAQAVERPATVAFFPTDATPAAESRWNTKGAPETIRLVSALANRGGFRLDTGSDLPHALVLARRHAANVVIDEMVTGSYHLSGLEGLALGRPTFGYLDARMVSVLTLLSGSDSLPWINLPLHRIEEPLEIFLQSPDLCALVGERSGQWMRTHWDTARMVGHYVKVYEDVLDGQKLLRHNSAFEVTDCALHDLSWRANIEDLQRRLDALY
jgi:hypothetical protein